MSIISGILVGIFLGYQTSLFILERNMVCYENKIQKLTIERSNLNQSNYNKFVYLHTLDSAIGSTQCCSLKIYNFKLDYYSKEDAKY